MFDWINLAIILLKVVNAIINWAHDRGMISEGRRQVIAEHAVAIATKVQTRDQIREKIDAMSDDQVNKALHDLVTADRPATKPVQPRSD